MQKKRFHLYLRQKLWKPWSPDGNLFLCDECKKLGYCRDAALRRLRMPEKVYDLNDYKNMIPLTALNSMALHNNNYAAGTLQKAFDAFHQDDYETAIHLFRMIINDNANLREANLFAAISYFFYNDYESAARFMGYYGDYQYGRGDVISSFLDMCSVKIKQHLPVANSENYCSEKVFAEQAYF